ncbi:MAG: DUF58 domain-containing protein [Herpetosiphonaceae bacterium]|nr:DUF58 domain-containing protein [Herpetosiphonaceae bacterium]
MPRFLLLGTLIFALIWTGLLASNGAFLVLAVPPLLYLGAALLDRPDPPKLRVTRTLSTDRVAQQQPVVVKLVIMNDGPQIEQLIARDLVPNGLEASDGATSVLTTLAPGATVKLEYTLKGLRGVYHFASEEVISSDRLGLFARRGVLPAPGHLLVLPEAVQLRRVDIRPRQTRVYSGLIPARQGGPGVEFFGVRSYQPGDPLRRVNARATARQAETLFVNDFEQERVADVGLILDARQRSNVRVGGGPLFEQAVEATAALADVFLKRGNRVGLVMYSAIVDWTFPGYGKLQRERILRALARAKTYDRRDVQGLDLLPMHLFPARSQIVLISPLQAEDLEMLMQLCAREYQLLVISPDPILFEVESLGSSRDVELAGQLARVERMLLLHKLRQLGVTVIEWQLGTPFYQIAYEALTRRHAPQVRRG